MQCDRTGATQITSVVLCPAMHDYYDLTNAGGGVEGYSLLCRPILEGGAEPVRRSRQAPALHLPNRCGVDPKPCRAEPKFRIRPSPAESRVRTRFPGSRLAPNSFSSLGKPIAARVRCPLVLPGLRGTLANIADFLKGWFGRRRQGKWGHGFEPSIPARWEMNPVRESEPSRRATKVRLEAVAYLPGTDGSNPFPSSGDLCKPCRAIADARDKQ